MLKGISRRWFVNTVGLIFLILVIFTVTLSFMVKGNVYASMTQALRGRMDELLNVLSYPDRKYHTPPEFMALARNYIENFPDKNLMEMMGINPQGKIFVTSTGFAPDQSQRMPDYLTALSTADGYGYWSGPLDTGEKVMAMTRVVRDPEGNILGTVRYLVSMEKADRQIFTIVIALIAVGIIIMLIVFFSGLYFVRSIIIPVRGVTATAIQISQGDFDVRIRKKKDDEIGKLCDTINDMASELGASERMKNDFISSVSHELRTPLTSIKGWAETLYTGVDRNMQEKGMQVIIRETERLSGIVEELLDFSRLQSGRLSLQMHSLSLDSVLDEAINLFISRAQTENRHLHYTKPVDLPLVMGDKDRLKQVFVNIIDNALKYTDPDGNINIACKKANDSVTVVVADDGCGIPSEHLPNIKNKFYKANQNVRGSGIGLAVADEIIAMHSGDLTITSEVDIGTTVEVFIPAAKALSEQGNVTENLV